MKARPISTCTVMGTGLSAPKSNVSRSAAPPFASEAAPATAALSGALPPGCSSVLLGSVSVAIVFSHLKNRSHQKPIPSAVLDHRSGEQRALTALHRDPRQLLAESLEQNDAPRPERPDFAQ